MGDYNHQRGSYDYKPQERAMESRDNANNRYDTNSYGYGKTGYDAQGRKHVAYGQNNPGDGYVQNTETVIGKTGYDAQGRKMPHVAYGQNDPGDGYFQNTETVIEQVQTYGNDLPNVGPMKENDGWGRSTSPPRGRPPMKTIISTMNWRTPKNSSNGYGGANENYYDGANGWNKPNSGYGGNYDNNANGWNKRNTGFDPYHSGYEGSKETIMENMQEPRLITSGGWDRPNRSAWSSPPGKESQLTSATNDIGAVVEYLQDAVRPAHAMAPGPRFAIPTPTVPTKDKREARNQYGGGVTIPQVAKTVYDYKSGIDNREAAKRYGGQRK